MQRTCIGALTLVVVLLACAPPAAKNAVPAAGGCVDTASCERAIAAANTKQLPALLAAYAAVTGDDGWPTLYRELLQTKAVPLIGSHERVVVGTQKLDLPPTTTTVPRARLLLALGRAAQLPQLLLAEGGATRQLFPVDVLAPHMMGLDPVVSLGASAVDVARMTHAMLTEAGVFDYVGAAATADRLRSLVRELPSGDEGAMRARFALWLLDSAGIALADTSRSTAATLPPKLSSPYAELLAVQLSRPKHAEAWHARGQRVVGGLGA